MDTFTPLEEFLAVHLEQQHAWNTAHFDLATKGKARAPSELRIRRPGDEPEPEQTIVSDPRQIAAWFTKHVGGR